MIWCLLIANFALAQDMPFLPSSGKTFVSAEYNNTEGGNSLTDLRGQVSVPVYKSEKSIWSVNARGQSVSLGQTLEIRDRNFRVPKHFGGGDLGFGANFPRPEGGQGFNASVGSTGRQLFHHENSRVLSATYFKEWKADAGRSWYFFLSYSNNRTTLNNIPLPGFAYGFQKDSLRLMAGFPFVWVSWMPRPWFLTASISPFGSYSDIAYSVAGPWQIMTSFVWQPRSYQNLAPDIDGERLLFDRKEAALGARAAFGPFHSVTLAYVYQYDRRFFIGESTSDRRSSAAQLDDSGGIQLKIRTAF